MSKSVGALVGAMALLCVNGADGREAQTVTCTIGGKIISGREDCLAALTNLSSNDSKAARKVFAAKTSSAAPKQSSTADPDRSIPLIPPPTLVVSLRKSMEDLKSLTSPSDVADATGATFSWTDNRVEQNRNWTAQALVAIGYKRFFGPEGGPYISQTFTGLYFGIDRQLNSKDVKKNVDDMTFGVRHEFTLANWQWTSHVFGIAGELVTDGAGTTKNWDLSVDYQPFGTDKGIGSRPLISYANWPFDALPYVYVTFSPKLRAEYRGSLDGSTDPLFKDHKSVARVGGSIGVTVSKNLADFTVGKVPFLIARSLVNVSYGWWYDTLSQRQFSYFDAAYTFNLDEAGNIGITFNYRNGELDTTAQRIELYKVALSAKFDADLLKPRE